MVAEADFMTARTAGFGERDGEIRLVFRHKLALAEAFVADVDKLTDYAVTVQNAVSYTHLTLPTNREV